MKRNNNVTLKRGALWQLTVIEFLMGMVSGAGLYHLVITLLSVGGKA